jgi:hypothetical protein
MKEIRFMVPIEWWGELHEAAHVRRLSLADLMRQLVRNFMLLRHEEARIEAMRERLAE